MYGDAYQSSGNVKNSESENREHDAALIAKRVISLPTNLKERHAYDANGQVIYSGYAPKGLAEDSDGWMLFKFTWASGNMTEKDVAFGNWADRVSESYS